jgi:hypothetical protein
MADRKSLGIIGLIMGGVTATIVTIGVVVVNWHLDGQLTLDEVRPVVVSLTMVLR